VGSVHVVVARSLALCSMWSTAEYSIAVLTNCCLVLSNSCMSRLGTIVYEI